MWSSRVACVALCTLWASAARAADVGEIALVADVGRQITQSGLVGTRYVQRAACAFYTSHDDRYDVLFVFTTVPLTALTRTPQGWATRSAARGLGRDIYRDSTAEYCSTRLRHAVKMSEVDALTDDPDAIYTGAGAATLSAVEVMGHELGHLWMAGLSYTGSDGARHCRIRGFTEPSEPPTSADCDGYRVSDFTQHWSAYLHGGSVMFGNHITELGGGRFRLENLGLKYSELDQYAMGLRDPSEVSPLYYVDVGGLAADSADFPVPRGQPREVTGQRVDFTIQDVIRAEGPRDPPRERCHLKAAFVVVHDERTAPTPQQLARVDAHRVRFEAWYAAATDGRGSVDTTLAGTGAGTVGCPAVGDPPPPPRDAGVVALDAAVPVASDAQPTADGGAPDVTSGVSDAGPLVTGDAATTADAAPAEPRTLMTEDCACRTTWGGVAPVEVILALVVVLWRRRRGARGAAPASSTGVALPGSHQRGRD